MQETDKNFNILLIVGTLLLMAFLIYMLLTPKIDKEKVENMNTLIDNYTNQIYS